MATLSGVVIGREGVDGKTDVGARLVGSAAIFLLRVLGDGIIGDWGRVTLMIVDCLESSVGMENSVDGELSGFGRSQRTRERGFADDCKLLGMFTTFRGRNSEERGSILDEGRTDSRDCG